VLSYLGRAQYLTGDYAAARQTLEKALARNKTDNLARLYLGLAQARLGDNQVGLNNIEASMKRINAWLNYLHEFWKGEGWDPGGVIHDAIKNALAMISSGNITWPRLFYDGESVGLAVEKQKKHFGSYPSIQLDSGVRRGAERLSLLPSEILMSSKKQGMDQGII
jgi:tetratricopeptide (TPR) repeat protein